MRSTKSHKCSNSFCPVFLSRNPQHQWVRRDGRCCHVLKQDSQGDTRPATLSFTDGVYTFLHSWDLRRKRGPAGRKRFIGLSAKAVRLDTEPWLPRSSSQSIFEGLLRKAVLRAYAVPTPLPWDTFLRQWFSSLLSLRLTSQAPGEALSENLQKSHVKDSGHSHGWELLICLRRGHHNSLAQNQLCYEQRTVQWTAKNRLPQCLVLMQIPLHQGRPERRSVNKRAALRLQRNQQTGR